MTKIQAKESVLRLLQVETIDAFQQEADRLCEEQDLPTLEAFCQERSPLIITETRRRVLKGITEQLKNKEASGVVLSGAYGSGKTLLRYAIRSLCQEPSTFDGEQFDQIKYGTDEVDCIELSLHRSSTTVDFLENTYYGLLESGSDISEEDLLDAYRENRGRLTFNDIRDEIQEDFIGAYKHPDTLTDVAEFVKELQPGEAVRTIEWFTDKYNSIEGAVPALYLDEFEQLHRERQERSEGEIFDPRTLRITQTLLRDAVDTDSKVPYLIFANTFTFEKMEERLGIEPDDLKRAEGGIIYSIDLTFSETVDLFNKLYRMYARHILPDYPSADPWLEKLEQASDSSDDYIYPFTHGSVEFVVDFVDTVELGDTRVIQSFRDVKDILVELLRQWDPDSDDRVDMEFLYQNGDKVREEARNSITNLEDFPGSERITETIEDDYREVPDLHTRVIKLITKTGMLKESVDPAVDESQQYFSLEDSREIAKEAGIPISDEDEVHNIWETAISRDYYSLESGRLLFNRARFIDTSKGDVTRSIGRQVQLDVDDHGLKSKSILSLWERFLDSETDGEVTTAEESDYLIYNPDRGNYLKTLYITYGQSVPPELDEKTIEDTPRLEMVLAFTPAEDDRESPIDVNCETIDCASLSFDASGIENKFISFFEGEFEKHQHTNRYSSLLDAIQDEYDDPSEFEAYTLFLKLGLQNTLLDDSLSEQLREKVVQRSFFELSTLTRNATRNKQFCYRTLGFEYEDYNAGKLRDAVYAVHHYDYFGKSLYYDEVLLEEGPHVGKSRERQSPEEFKTFVDEKLSTEPFVDGDTLNPEYSDRMKAIMTRIAQKVDQADDEDTVTYVDVVETIFGIRDLSRLQSYAEVGIYLILSLGDELERGRWQLNDDVDQEREITLEPPLDSKAKYEDVRDGLQDTIKKAVLDKAAENDVESDIDKLQTKLDKISPDDQIAYLSRIEKEHVVPWEGDYEGIIDRIDDVRSEDGYEDTPVSQYLSILAEELPNNDKHLLYLIEQPLRTLLSQLEDAQSAVRTRQKLHDHVDVLTAFPDDFDRSELEDPDIPIMTNVASHAESSDPRSTIANATIQEDLGPLFDDSSETTVDDVLPGLRQTIDNIVPDTSDEDDEAADYDELEEQFEEDIETVDTRIETLRSQYVEQVEDDKQWANDLERELLSEPDRLGNARSYLEQCYSALDISNDELPEAETFSKNWRQWQEREPKIKEDLLENETVINRIPDFVEDIDGEDIALATDTDVPEVIDQLSNEEFKQLLEGTTHEKLQAYFVAQRVLQSMNDDEQDEDELEQTAEVDQ